MAIRKHPAGRVGADEDMRVGKWSVIEVIPKMKKK